MRTAPPATTPTTATPAGATAPPPLVRVATYRRASTDETNQPWTLDAQQTRLASYIAAFPEWTHADDYVERASAKNIEGRPQLRKLMAAARAGEYDLVLVVSIDRWARSILDLMVTITDLDAAGVKFCSVTEAINTDGAAGRMMLQMFGVFAEFERNRIIERIHRGNAAKLAKGIPLNGRVGYGLTVNRHTGVIEADPAAIGVVGRILTEYATGRRGLRAIATGLNDDGIAGPGGNRWAVHSVSDVLRNRTFVGELRHRDQWLPGAHDPLVDVEVFARAQQLLDAKKDLTVAARSRGEFLLTSVMRCGHCGGAYVGTSGTARNGEKVLYYACTAQRRWGKAHCAAPSVRADVLERLVVDQALAMYSDTALFAQAVTARLDEHARRHGPLLDELDAVRGQVASKTRVRDRYRADYENGDLSAARYEARAGELDTELAALARRQVELEAQADAPDVPDIPTDAQLARLRDGLATQLRGGDAALRKALFGVLLAGLVVHAADDIRPTWRLYAPTETGETVLPDGRRRRSNAPPTRVRHREVAEPGDRFASCRSGWS